MQFGSFVPIECHRPTEVNGVVLAAAVLFKH